MPNLNITDLARLRLEPGEVLLVRLPRNCDQTQVQNARNMMADFLEAHGLKWPILFTRDDVEYVALNGAVAEKLA